MHTPLPVKIPLLVWEAGLGCTVLVLTILVTHCDASVVVAPLLRVALPVAGALVPAALHGHRVAHEV